MTNTTAADAAMNVDPRAHDEAEARLFEQYGRAERNLSAHIGQMHHLAGDRRNYTGRVPAWGMTLAQVCDQLRETDSQGLGVRSKGASAALAREEELRTRVHEIQVEIEQAEAIYRQHGWSRFFPCNNRDGHIHSSLRGCPSVRWSTDMAWYPSLSGKTVEEAVADLGPALCQICFPAAKAEHKRMTLGQVKDERTRAEREAVKAARDAARNAKRLAGDEVFRTRYGTDRVETVALCKELIRRPVSEAAQLRWYQNPARKTDWQGPLDGLERIIRNTTDFLAQMEADAEQAKQVLLAREAAHEGWGATQADIDKMIASATKKAAKDWA